VVFHVGGSLAYLIWESGGSAGPGPVTARCDLGIRMAARGRYDVAEASIVVCAHSALSYTVT
jgi:hypothetical protein